MQPRILDSREALKALRLSDAGKSRRIIAVSGPTCSGKTTFAKRLYELLAAANTSAVIIPLDSYFRDFNDPQLPTNEAGRRLFDIPGAFWQDQFVEAVKCLFAGHSIHLPFYDISRNKRLPWINPARFPAKVIIAEGLFAGMFLQQTSLPVFNVYMDTAWEVCMERRIDRDQHHLGVTAEVVESHFRQKILPYWDQCEIQKKTADIIISMKGDDNHGR